MFAELIASLAASLPLAPPTVPLAGPALAPLATLQPTAQQGSRAEADQEIPSIQVEGEFFVLNFAEKDGEEGMSLYQFVKACEQATALQFIILEGESQNLQNETIRMIGTKRIPKRDFYSFFQIIMFIHNYSCVEVGAGPTSVIVIQSNAPTGGRAGQSSITQKSLYVLPEELEDYADQPATQITTVVTLPNTDVRNLSNSLRTLLTDTNAMNMVPAGNSDTLILRGYGSYIVQIARLLRLVDEESREELPPMPVFEYVPLEFASADEVADIVEQLVEAQREALRSIQQNRADGQAQRLPQNEADVKIVVDRRTNSLAITALPDDIPRVKELIARLDTEVIEPERNYHIYALENVGAEDLSDVLEDFLDDAQRITQSSGGTGGRTNQAGQGGGTSGSEDVVVIAEPGTNALLIAANKTRYAEVLELIKKLDRRADQVLIETALIELTGNEFQDIGVELGFADLPGVGETGGFGVSGFGLSTLEDLDLDGIPDSRVPTFADGLTAGILDGDDFSLPLLVRFLKTRDNANVLSVPSILVNNNGSATISTLDEQPFTQVTAFGGAGAGGQTQENFQGYQEAGITLTISPSISASRYLRLGVELEVSNFLGATQAANIPPPRVTRRLETTINVPDGDTMVIGGVITNNTTDERTQLPWLGDIPVLGALFRRDVVTQDRRTLYFFVTPHILADEDFADLAQFSYERKLEASEIIGADRLRTIDPDFGVVDDEDALIGFEVPLYSRPPTGEVSGDDVGLDAEARAALLEQANEEAPAGGND